MTIARVLAMRYSLLAVQAEEPMTAHVRRAARKRAALCRDRRLSGKALRPENPLTASPEIAML